jgi:transglutaminase/protease-like cytokinesis protein 3
VCEGYARLMVELGRLTGDRIVYVTGEVREQHGELAPVGHAWNAVEVHGAWYLLDATWDDPTMADGSDAYLTDYLFIPPQLAGLNHYPDDVRWQLRADPLGRAEFLRQPLATPGLARERLVLKSPTSLVVNAQETFALQLENPARASVMLVVGQQRECGPTSDVDVSLSCPVERGAKEATLFVQGAKPGTYESIVSFRLQ